MTGRREDRNRIPRALVGFSNALLVTGDRKYVDAWRDMIDGGQPPRARQANGRVEYPTMHGADGWYGWQRDPWSVGALEVWYWSMSDADRARVGANPWLEFLEGRNPGYAGNGARARPGRAFRASSRRSAPIGRRPTSVSPTTCSTRIRRQPTRWCG